MSHPFSIYTDEVLAFALGGRQGNAVAPGVPHEGNVSRFRDRVLRTLDAGGMRHVVLFGLGSGCVARVLARSLPPPVELTVVCGTRSWPAGCRTGGLSLDRTGGPDPASLRHLHLGAWLLLWLAGIGPRRISGHFFPEPLDPPKKIACDSKAAFHGEPATSHCRGAIRDRSPAPGFPLPLCCRLRSRNWKGSSRAIPEVVSEAVAALGCAGCACRGPGRLCLARVRAPSGQAPGAGFRGPAQCHAGGLPGGLGLFSGCRRTAGCGPEGHVARTFGHARRRRRRLSSVHPVPRCGHAQGRLRVCGPISRPDSSAASTPTGPCPGSSGPCMNVW